MFTESRKKLGYVNGDFGTIVRKEGSTIHVRIDKTGDIVMINRVDHYRYQMKYDDTKRDLVKVTPYVQKTNQYPLKLAYAFTIHKSQGQTYEQVVLDLHSHIFASGQLYVALSRVKTLSGLYLTKPVSISDIIVDKSLETNADSEDIYYDEISSGLLIGEIRRNRAELLESLSIYYRMVILGEKPEDLLSEIEENN